VRTVLFCSVALATALRHSCLLVAVEDEPV
jgi:hypothetical protein